MLANAVLSWQIAWEAGFGLLLLHALVEEALVRQGLRRGGLVALPAGLLLFRFRWWLGGRESLELVISLLLAVLLPCLFLGLRAGGERPGKAGRWLGGAAGLLLPQAAVWDLARWPFRFSALPANTAVNTQLVGEAAGVVLGGALALAGLWALSAALAPFCAGRVPGRDLPPVNGQAAGVDRTALRFLGWIALGAYWLKNVVVTLQTLFAAGYLPLSPIAFRLLVPLVNGLARFPGLLLALGAVLALVALAAARRLPAPAPAWRPPRRRMLLAFNLARRRRAAGAVVLLSAALALVSFQQAVAERGAEASPAVPVAAVGGAIRLPLAELADGKLHRYAYTAAGGTEVRFIVLDRGGGLYGSGLDYCEFCGPTGYVERGDQVVCVNCDVVINRVTVGFPGGCNPLPLPSRLAGDELVILAADLEAEKGKFTE